MGLTSCLKNCKLPKPFVNVLNPSAVKTCPKNEQPIGRNQIDKDGNYAPIYTKHIIEPVDAQDKNDEQQRITFTRLTTEKMFASLAIIKAYYALVQSALFPYNADDIMHVDELIVKEFGQLSSLVNSFHDSRPLELSENEFYLTMCRQLSACIQTYRTKVKKLKFRTVSLDSQISLLRDELNKKDALNKDLFETVGLNGSVSVTGGFIQLRIIKISYFVKELHHTIKSIRHFVKLMVNRMLFAGWDLDAVADALQPGVSYWGTNDICFAFEAYICREMFEAFQFPNFSISKEPLPHPKYWRSYFARKYLELKSVKPSDYISKNHDSSLATFFKLRYMTVINPKLELSLFGNVNFRNHIKIGGIPEAPFVNSFLEMAKRVLRLHYLALVMDSNCSIFQVPKGSRFSEVYMESVHEDPFLSSDDSSSQVAFTVVPGFELCRTIIQCEVYLSKPGKLPDMP